MKTIILLTLTTVMASIVSMGQQAVTSVATAIVNDQIGEASFREKKGKKETKLTKDKDLAKKLYPNQEIRCNANCQLELLLCTGSKVILKVEDGWYRVPVLTCEKEKFIPGFKNYLQPGGRQATYKEDRDRETRKRMLIGALIGNGRGVVGAGIGAGIGAASTSMRRFASRPDYYGRWFFQYPYEGVAVVPDLFFFDIDGERAATRRIRLVIALSAFDDDHISSDSPEFRQELYFEKEKLLAPSGDPFNLELMRSFLRKARNPSAASPTRVYCTITVSGVPNTSTENLKSHTFGFEFYVMRSFDEQGVLEVLESLNEETGIARHLGRGDVFESLGLIKLAIEEYRKALELSPNNESIRAKVKALEEF